MYSQYINVSEWPMGSNVKQSVIPDVHYNSVMLRSIKVIVSILGIT